MYARAMGENELQLLRRMAHEACEAGDFKGAFGAWRNVLRLAPGSMEAKIELSYLESISGNYRGAREWALEASKSRSHSPRESIALLQRLRTFNAGELICALARKLICAEDVSSLVLAECARQLSNLNVFDLALDCADRAVQIDSTCSKSRLMRARLRTFHGDIELARKDYQHLVDVRAEIGDALAGLAEISKQSASSNHVQQLRMLLKTSGQDPGQVAVVARALHKELDDIGEFREAWWALQMMCMAKRAMHRYDRPEMQSLFDKLMRLDGVTPRGHAENRAGKIPIFIVGMHRSGTTLLEQLLAGNSRVAALGELYDFTSAIRDITGRTCKVPIDASIVDCIQPMHYPEIGRAYLDGVSWRLGNESHFTDKQPGNFLNTWFICEALPSAKILHVTRNPVDVCFSNLRELYSDVNLHTYDQIELAEYYWNYKKLMDHSCGVHANRILNVDYQKLVVDTESVMREVSEFCGLEFDEGMLSTATSGRAVSTASAVQVREPVRMGGVPKWLNYANEIQPLIRALRFEA